MRVLLVLLVAVVSSCATPDCDSTGGLGAYSSDLADNEYVDRDYQDPVLSLTAVNGTQRFAAVDEGCETSVPLDAVVARSEDSTIATVQTLDGTVEVTGVAPGETSIDLSAAGQAGWLAATVAHVEQLALVARELGAPGAFYAGTPFASILLLDSSGRPVVDDGLAVDGGLALGDRWNRLAIGSAAPGVYPLTIHASGRDWPVTATIVDHITDITARDATLEAASADMVEVCFFAHADGVVVAGVPWTFDIDGGPPIAGDNRANCIRLGSRTSTPHIVTAHALGFSAATTVSPR